MPRSGISYSPALEWRLAARWAHYRYEEFVALEGEAQSEIVAAYRIAMQMEAVLAQEQAREMRQAQRRGTGGRR